MAFLGSEGRRKYCRLRHWRIPKNFNIEEWQTAIGKIVNEFEPELRLFDMANFKDHSKWLKFVEEKYGIVRCYTCRGDHTSHDPLKKSFPACTCRKCYPRGNALPSLQQLAAKTIQKRADEFFLLLSCCLTAKNLFNRECRLYLDIQDEWYIFMERYALYLSICCNGLSDRMIQYCIENWDYGCNLNYLKKNEVGFPSAYYESASGNARFDYCNVLICKLRNTNNFKKDLYKVLEQMFPDIFDK